MQTRSVGIDLGKTTFHLVALGEHGKLLVRKKFSQKQLITFTANLQASLIGLEACSGAHFLGRGLHGKPTRAKQCENKTAARVATRISGDCPAIFQH